MKTQYEKNMGLINSYDPWGDPPDEYYENRVDVEKSRNRRAASRFSSDYDDNNYEYNRFGANR
jgi:hypothetical protein